MESLIDAAADARLRAYAPYSNFKVGAALYAGSGRVYRGANVENVSLGLTVCAERACVTAAVEGGDTRFVRLAIVTDSQKPAVPCGACRQVLAEFGTDLEIVAVTVSGDRARYRLADLIPLPNQGILETFHVEHV